MIVGIDPGLKGGMVAMQHNRCVAQVRMSDVAPDGWRPGVARLIADYANEWRDIDNLCIAYIEALGRRPGEGAVGASTAGVGWGLIVGALTATGVRVQTVTPAAWRRAAGLPARSADADGKRAAKADVASWAAQVPGLTLMYPRCRTIDQGIADAACIAFAGGIAEARR